MKQPSLVLKCHTLRVVSLICEVPLVTDSLLVFVPGDAGVLDDLDHVLPELVEHRRPVFEPLPDLETRELPRGIAAALAYWAFEIQVRLGRVCPITFKLR